MIDHLSYNSKHQNNNSKKKKTEQKTGKSVVSQRKGMTPAHLKTFSVGAGMVIKNGQSKSKAISYLNLKHVVTLSELKPRLYNLLHVILI